MVDIAHNLIRMTAVTGVTAPSGRPAARHRLAAPCLRADLPLAVFAKSLSIHRSRRSRQGCAGLASRIPLGRYIV